MNPSLTIPTAPPEYPAMDYALLRSAGIRLLERLGGQVWTDFNAHDPGITILEQLCYAITDLGYRIHYDVKDLLASGDEDPYHSLCSPAKVLTTAPVTLTDLRKLLIDVDGVKNAWVEPAEISHPGLAYDPAEDSLRLQSSASQPASREAAPLRGLYNIWIEKDETAADDATILREVNRRLHACRSLCEDFNPFDPQTTILPGQEIIIEARIEIGAVEDPERLLAEIYQTLANAISPRIRFYSLPQMLAQGKAIDEILDGPALEHGFIDDAELRRFQRKAGLRASDLIREIMDVEGVVTVGKISLSADGKPPEAWYLKLDPERAPSLNVGKSVIQLARGGIEARPDLTRVSTKFGNPQKTVADEPLPESQRDVRLPAGRDRKIGQYHSIQHQFPAVYGIGSMGLPESASPQRKAWAKQLKAYLMLFDQLLANYFAQLANAKELFSFYADGPQTYFSQTIADVSLGLDEIYRPDPDKIQAITAASALAADIADDDPACFERKNRFLNHLLARFAEQFSDYSLNQYARHGGNNLIRDKCAFLQDYPAIGAARGAGFDYTAGSENISGLEKRISRKLGLPSHHEQYLSAVKAGGEGWFFMLEHILLRPRSSDEAQFAQTAVGGIGGQTAFLARPVGKDPYSHQLSFIFPDWIERFNAPGFRNLIEKTLREETPAHIRIYIHWLDQTSMLAFESARKDWLETVIDGRLWSDPISKSDDDPNRMTLLKLRDARDRMMQILGIGIPYPLRDVKLDYPETVVFQNSTQIQILGGQAGVLYQLCDEDGNVVLDENGGRFEVLPEAGQAVLLNTPVITKDIIFIILATRKAEDAQGNKLRLEAYLNQVVAIQAGIDTKVRVAFQPADGQIVNGNQIIINYADPVKVMIFKSQEGISYKLVAGAKDLSKPVKGNKDDIPLDSTDGFMEDIPINILAYRTSYSKTSAILDTNLSILVRPNPALAVNVEKSILDYKAASKLTLVAPQASAEYCLYKREVASNEYLPDGTPGCLIIHTDEGRDVAVRAPAKVTDCGAPSGFVPLGLLKDKDADGNLFISTDSLLEDTLFIVQAAKIENREQIQLDQAVVVLTRPDPACAVSVAGAEVIAGLTGMAQVSGTQKGVHYQLRLDADNTPVNLPGYHWEDRGVETVRVEVDLVVEGQGEPILLLPTAAITKATTFNVLAVKTLTGVSVQLNDKAAIKVHIDTSIMAAFRPAQGQVVRDAGMVVSYGDKITVTVSGSEEGASYELVTGPSDKLVKLSVSKKGGKGDVTLVSTAGFTEDTPIKVRAWRTAEQDVWALLDVDLAALVRPNPALTVNIEKSIVDYKTDTRLMLVAPQASVEYRLYKRDVASDEYLPDGTDGGLLVPTDEGRKVTVKAPAKIADWSAPAGFVPLDLFKDSAGNLSASTGSLLEDALFIVQAAKIENREQLQLDQAVVVLARPDPGPVVAAQAAAVPGKTPGVVTVSGTQKGVSYQLRLDADNTPVNLPGYHWEDRGVETVRVEVDLVVEGHGEHILRLPTGPITAKTTFNVLAIKTITGVSKQLTGKAKIDILAA